jgi:transcriptional regulator with XRE-family HTH domain
MHCRPMPPGTRVLADADRLAAWLRLDLGREMRLARHQSGATMQQVADRLGWSKSKVSRIERGRSIAVTVADVACLAAAVGLRPSLKLFPAARALRDVGQLELLAALNSRMHPSWHTRQEVPMPQPNDLRAADQLSSIGGCTVMVEAYRRLSDFQAQCRSALLKQRDLGANRLVLLVEDTRANRRALAEAGAEPMRSYPISQRAMLAALAAGRDPGGDGIVLRRVRPAVAPHATKGEGTAARSSLVAPDDTGVV